MTKLKYPKNSTDISLKIPFNVLILRKYFTFSVKIMWKNVYSICEIETVDLQNFKWQLNVAKPNHVLSSLKMILKLDPPTSSSMLNVLNLLHAFIFILRINVAHLQCKITVECSATISLSLNLVCAFSWTIKMR